jgi:outer membrane protein assembly factor BamB
MHMPRILGVAVVMLSASIATSGAQDSPQDYTQWRGQQRDGSASGFTEPASWPETLTRQWKVEAGEGYATPLVVGDSVYVFTRQEEREVIQALSAKTGTEQWRSTYPAPYAPSQPAAKHGAGPKATPLYQDGKLFTLGISGIVSAFDAGSGTLLWQTPPPAEPPFFSAASSPSVRRVWSSCTQETMVR